MDIDFCNCIEDISSEYSYINCDIVRLCNDILIDELPRDIINTIFSFIVEYLSYNTASYPNKFFKLNYNCIYKHIIGVCDTTASEYYDHNYKSFECSSLRYLINGIPICSHEYETNRNYYNKKYLDCALCLKNLDNCGGIFPDNESLIPSSILIDSNNLLAHHYVLHKYELDDNDLVDMFKKWFINKQFICFKTDLRSGFNYGKIYPYPFKDYSMDQIITGLMADIYNKFNDINKLYDVIEELADGKIDMTIITTYLQLPPPILKKIISLSSVKIIENIIKHQQYINKSIISSNLDKLSIELVIFIIDNKELNLDIELLNKILSKYPTTLSNMILNNYFTMDMIHEHKNNITKDC